MFKQDMGEPAKGLTLDRIDTNGPYSKTNCKWSTSKEQNRNRRNNRLVAYKGKAITFAEAVEIAGKSMGKFINV